MIYVFGVLTLLIAAGIIIIRNQGKRLKQQKSTIDSYEKAVKKRDQTNTEFQEILHAESEKKASLYSGSNRDRFNASLDILSDNDEP